MICVDEIRRHVSYNGETGDLRCEMPFGNKYLPGDIIKSRHNKGYIAFYYFGKYLLGHRVAWAIQTGAWPSEEIDHRDGDRSNNRLDNLRLASHAENMQNRPIQVNNKSGVPGVWFEKRTGRWRAEIQLGGRQIRAGRFVSFKDASAAVAELRRKHHSFQPIPRGLAA